MTNLGVFVGNLTSEVKQFESWLGKPVGSVLAYTSENDWNNADPGWQIGSQQYLGGSGRRLRWSIPAWPKADGLAQMRRVAGGQEFSRHQGWARACLAQRSGDTDPIYVRTAWELGGEWFPWTQDAKADPEAFKRALNRFYEAFKSVSPRFRTQFDFVPDRMWIVDDVEVGPEWLYPGDQWIDIISQDVYWHPQYDGNDPVAAFARHNTGLKRGLQYCRDFARARGKRLAVPEWGAPGNRPDLNGARFIELMAAWFQASDCEFADYWNSTSAYDGLLSDGQPSATAAALKKLYLEGVGTTVPVPTPGPTPTPTPSPDLNPVMLYAGTGNDVLVLRISQDYHKAAAQYTVRVDGIQIGSTFSASAKHGVASDTLTLRGEWAVGNHTAVITFLNDDWGGTAATDRNLYLDGASLNGIPIGNSTFDMKSNDSYTVPFTKAGTAPPPNPEPPGDLQARIAELETENAALEAEMVRLSADNAQLRTLHEHLLAVERAAKAAVTALSAALNA